MSVVSHFTFKTAPAMQLASMIYAAKGNNSSSHSSTFQPCQIHSLMTMTFGDVRLWKCHRVDYVLVVIESFVCRGMPRPQAVCCLKAGMSRRRLLLGLEVVEQDAALLGLLTPVLDDDARAVDDLAGVALAVDLACFARQSVRGVSGD